MRNELLAGTVMPASAELPKARNRGRPPAAKAPLPEPAPRPFERPAYMNIPTWCAFTGMSRTGVYEAVAFAHLVTIKVGKKRLVDVEQGLSWLHSLAAPTSKAA